MIIAKIVQEGQIITLKDVVPTFKYSANLQMQFVRDEQYKDCVLTGWYKKHKGEEYLLDIKEDGTFTLRKDVFSKEGSVYFSFALNRTDGEIIHLGVVDFEVKQSFGNDSAILPEEQETWISVVSSAAREAIKEDVELVKEKAIESSNSAKSAIESAGVAQSSANAALEAKEKALEYMASAERFKNSASNFAEQANLARTEASKSATNASNSASSSLENANKAKEHLDSVIEKTNTFNSDYTNKVNSFNEDYTSKVEGFNSNVEQANTDLDKKMADANTSLDTKISEANNAIDAKVTEATEQASKAKQEADRAQLATDGKLDKQQGAENAGKAMVVDTDGNIVPGSALPDNVYTQEEVDYLLADKMDKPYTDITITEDTFIDCTMDGNLKINSIIGNTTQEENPTPENPSEIKGVTELNIKTVGKNLIDYTKLSFSRAGLENKIVTSNITDHYYSHFSISVSSFFNGKSITFSFLPLQDFNRHVSIIAFYDGGYIERSSENGVPHVTIEIPDDKNILNFEFRFNRSRERFTDTVSKFSNFQIEASDTATEYMLHTESSVMYDLENPLLKIGDVADIIDVTNLKRINNIAKQNLNDLNFVYSDEKNGFVRFYAVANQQLKYCGKTYSNVLPSFNTYDYTRESIYAGNANGGITISIIVEKKKLTELTDAGLKKYINNPNAYVLHALSVSTKESLPEEFIHALKQLKTYSPVTNIFLDGEVKPTIYAQYPKDIVAIVEKLETKILTLQTEVVKNV